MPVRAKWFLASVILFACSFALLANAADVQALEIGTSVYGRVTDNSVGLAGAQIRVLNTDTWEWDLAAETDSNGYYEAQLPAGTYSLSCYASEKYQEQSINNVVANPANPTEKNFQLVSYPKAVYGWVKDPATGDGIAGAGVMLDADPSSGVSFSRWATTGADGYFEFYAPAGLYELRAGKTGYQSFFTDGLSFDGGDVAVRQDCSLAAYPKAIYGTVTDSSTGLAIGGATVVLSDMDDGAAFDDWATTSATGGYAFYKLAGTYELNVYASGYRSVSVSGVVFDGGATPVLRDVALDPVTGTNLTLHASQSALTEAGSSIELTATLLADPAPGSPLNAQRLEIQAWDPEVGDWAAIQTLETDASGRASCTLVPVASTSYRAVYAGEGAYTASTSEEVVVSVPVPAYLTIVSSQTTLSKYDASVVVTGRLMQDVSEDLGVSGALVELQANSTGVWKTVKVLTTTGLTSAAPGSVAWTMTPRVTTSYRFVYSGLPGSFEAKTSNEVKVVARAYVSNVVPYRYHTRYYKLYGSIKPKHTAGTPVVRIYRWKKINGSWKAYDYVTAKAADYTSTTSRYTVKHKFPSTGTWRLKAVHPEDAGHAKSSSSYSYLVVK